MAPPKMRKDKTLDDMNAGGKSLSGVRTAPDGPEPDAAPEGEETDDPIVRVQVMKEGYYYNKHPLPLNSVIEIPLSQVDLHRERGYEFGPVPDDYDGEIYDISEEWQPEQNDA